MYRENKKYNNNNNRRYKHQKPLMDCYGRFLCKDNCYRSIDEITSVDLYSTKLYGIYCDKLYERQYYRYKKYFKDGKMLSCKNIYRSIEEVEKDGELEKEAYRAYQEELERRWERENRIFYDYLGINMKKVREDLEHFKSVRKKRISKIIELKRKANSFNDYYIDRSRVTPEDERELDRLFNEARKVSPHPEYLNNPIDIPPFLKFAEVGVNPKCYGYVLGELIASEGFRKLREQVKKERMLSIHYPLQ